MSEEYRIEKAGMQFTVIDLRGERLVGDFPTEDAARQEIQRCQRDDAMYETASLLGEHAIKAHMQIHNVDRATSEYWIRSAMAEAEPVGRESEIRLNASVSPEYVVLVDTNRKYKAVSDSFCKLLGYEREQLIGMKCDEVTAPGTNAIPIVFELFMRSGYMHGVWIFVNRTKVRILVRYESWLRSDGLIECNMELLGAGA